jgi:hypothetical protein
MGCANHTLLPRLFTLHEGSDNSRILGTVSKYITGFAQPRADAPLVVGIMAGVAEALFGLRISLIR